MNSQKYNSQMYIILTVYAIFMIYKYEISLYKDVRDENVDLEMQEILLACCKCPLKDQINRGLIFKWVKMGFHMR